ncbi:MAG TPA: hypothetical protein VMH37_10920 [Candidatus Binataceae bacterium]|nr:hypothetical protein [Candidatus Binataceae bacterium]
MEDSRRIAEMMNPGAYQVEGTLRCQACSDEICEPPRVLRFSLPLTIEAGIPPAPAKA